MPEVPFEILKEAWTTWELADGALLRCRAELVWVLSVEGAGPASQVRTNLAVAALAPPALHRDPTPGGPTLSGQTPDHVFRAGDWRLGIGGESLYLLADGSMLRLSLTLQEVKRYAVYGANREPVYQASAVTEVLLSSKVEPPPARPPDMIDGPSKTSA